MIVFLAPFFNEYLRFDQCGKYLPIKKLNGERADLVAEKDEERIAIEVESGGSEAIENIKKCLDAGFSLVVSVSINRKIENEIRNAIKEKNLEERKDKVLILNSGEFE